MSALETLFPRLEPFETFDADGGIISVPNTGVYTLLLAVSPAYYFFLRQVQIGVYDAGAPPVVTWQLTQDGIPIRPWEAQRLVGGQTMVFNISINRLVYPMRQLVLAARVPTTAVGAFDVTGRLTGEFLREKKGLLARPVNLWEQIRGRA